MDMRVVLLRTLLLGALRMMNIHLRRTNSKTAKFRREEEAPSAGSPSCLTSATEEASRVRCKTPLRNHNQVELTNLELKEAQPAKCISRKPQFCLPAMQIVWGDSGFERCSETSPVGFYRNWCLKNVTFQQNVKKWLTWWLAFDRQSFTGGIRRSVFPSAVYQQEHELLTDRGVLPPAVRRGNKTNEFL